MTADRFQIPRVCRISVHCSFALILFMVVAMGCQTPRKMTGVPASSAKVASPAEGRDEGQHPPKQFTAKIADADSIVVRSYLAYVDKRHRDMMFVITGATVNKIVKAVSSSGRLPGLVDNIPSWNLEFRKGTNVVATVTFEGKILDYYPGKDQVQYMDRCGVLENLDQELLRRTEPLASN